MLCLIHLLQAFFIGMFWASFEVGTMAPPDNGPQLLHASAIAVFLADLEVHKRIDRIYQLEKDSQQRDPEVLRPYTRHPNY